MSCFKNYFDEKYIDLKPNHTQLDSLIEKEKEYLLVSGDFFGIQKFIFERLSCKNAAKVLRAKSAFVQLFVVYVADLICHTLGIDKRFILSTNAGKLEILSSNTDERTIGDLQHKINDYFIKHFYGLSGLSLSTVVCKGNEFYNKESYGLLRQRVLDEVELKKFNKLDLLHRKDFVLNYDNNINNQTLCPICNIRKKKEESCEICSRFISMGKLLVEDTDKTILSSDIGIEIDGFKTELNIDSKIKSYILKEEYDSPAEFTILAEMSCNQLETGIKALAVVKADVDNMGMYLKESDVSDSFENFDLFSHTLDNFFSIYVPKLMREKYHHSYTVFTGGDDLFLLGAWDEMLMLSRQIQKEFKQFTKGKLSISFGIALAKPSHPIAHLAEYTEDLLEEAKGIDNNKNAISLFGETVKWNSYLKVYEKLDNTFKLLENTENTGFLYRLLELVEMKKKVLQGDIEATIWKSKLRYSWSRNMSTEDPRMLESLDKSIENHPSETKMFLSEYIYKRRKV